MSEILGDVLSFTTPPVVGAGTPTPTPTPSGPCACPPPPGVGTPISGGTSTPGSSGGTTSDTLGNAGWTPPGEGWTVTHCTNAGGVPMTYATAAVAEDFTGVRDPRVWIDARFKLYPGGTDAPLEMALGPGPIQDPPDYEDGKKRGMVRSLRGIRRSLSTEDGEIVGSRVSADLDDRSRTLRDLLGAASSKRVHGSEMNVKIISEGRRRSRLEPTVLFRGVMRGHSLDRQIQARLEFEDWLTSEYGPLGSKRTISDRKLTPGLFAGLPQKNQGKNQRIILGIVGDWGAIDPTTGAAAEKGIIPVETVGNRLIGGVAYTELFVCGHAVEGFDVYGQDDDDPTLRSKVPESLFGSDFLAPGHAGWPFPTNYFDYTDTDTGKVHRVTTFFAKGAKADAHNNGQITFAVNACGMEAHGDATGLAVDGAFYATQLLVDNFIHRSYYTGTYVGATQYSNGVYKTKSASFTAAQTLTQGWIGGVGYQMGMVIQDNLLSRDILRRIAQTFHCRFFWTWAMQFAVMVPDDTADISTAPRLRQPVPVRAPVVPDYVIDYLANPIRYNYDYDYDAQRWRGRQGEVRDQDAIDQMGGERDLVIDCWASRDPTTVRDAMARTLLWRKYEQETASIELDLSGLNHELGDIVLVQSQDGPGATGYAFAPFLLTDAEFKPSGPGAQSGANRVVFSGVAMADIARTVSAFDAVTFNHATFA